MRHHLLLVTHVLEMVHQTDEAHLQSLGHIITLIVILMQHKSYVSNTKLDSETNSTDLALLLCPWTIPQFLELHHWWPLCQCKDELLNFQV